MLDISDKKKQGKTVATITLLLTSLLVASSSLLYTNILSLSGNENNNNNNNLIYAQTSNPNVTSTTPHELPGVKITSPARGQQIPIGNANNNSVLTIKGVSTSSTNSNCDVYIIIDGIKPYQKTLPTGQRGPYDFSTWKYQLNNEYAAIKPGSNKLTSKISCAANPTNVSKSYSVNITGVASTTGAFSPFTSKQQHPQTSKTITISNNKVNNNNNLTLDNNSTHTNGTSSLSEKKDIQQQQQPATISQQQMSAAPAIRTVNDSGNGGYSVSNNSGTILKPEIKIISPAKGEQVPVGKDLLVSGTSSSKAISPDCKVSVKVNGISPYHDVSANGGIGKDDYSKWNFTLTPAYTTIKEGQNKINAKFSCSNNPNLVSHNSINVTGVSTIVNNTTTATAGRGNNQQQRLSESNNPTPSVLPLSSPNPKILSVLTNVTKNPVISGGRQTMTITTSDGISNDKVIGATVNGKVMDTNGLTDKEFRNTTDVNGQVSYSWLINKATKPGLFVVQYNVTADGYKPNSATSSFDVLAQGGGSSSSVSSTNNDHHHISSTGSSNNDHHHISSTGSTGKTSDKGGIGNGHQGKDNGNDAGGHGVAGGKGSG